MMIERRMTEKRKLNGGPEKTVTWIWLESGQLKVEFYDFSALAQSMFGNDIAYTLSVTENEMKKLYALTKQNKGSLLDWISKTFSGYFEIKRWLDDNKIEYTKETESWA